MRRLSRRTLLRGAGVALALPYLEEMAVAAEPPKRCFTLFHGLGVPKAMQMDGFAGALEPYAAIKDKVAIFRNVNMPGPGVAHGGGVTVFTGTDALSNNRSGGPTIDQFTKKLWYPGGPPTKFGTLSVGVFFRRAIGAFQHIRCWNADGSQTVAPIENPRDLFNRLFGSPVAAPTGGAPDPAEAARARVRRSVMDTVLAQYQRYTGTASPLGTLSRRRLQDHFERLREIERRVFAVPGGEMVACKTPGAPANVPNLPYGFSGATDGNAVKATVTQIETAFRLNAELFVTAVRCDLVRFGNMMCESAGGHIALSGAYKGFTFPGDKSTHAYFHSNNTTVMKWNAHFLGSQMVHALQLLDDPNFRDPNGKTILDNSLVLVSTEVGTNHDDNGVFHALAGGGGRFRLGRFYDDRISATELYNTALRGFGVSDMLGAAKYFRAPVSGLLA
jgi:hypothetical protein